MKPSEALAEDCRKVGVGLIVVDALGAALSGSLGGWATFWIVLTGIALMFVGYWFHSKEG